MKKYKGEILIVLGCILIIGITITFAYFLANIEGEGKSITLKSKNLKITFTESNNLSGENISPGWSKTSTFTVKNEVDKDYTYNIVIKDLINTFVTTGNLQYKVTSTDGGYNMADFKDIPKSNAKSNKPIGKNITISGNTTQTYTVLFTYKNSEDNQAEDMGKILSGQIIIDEFINTTLAEEILEDNPTISTRYDFSIPFTTNTPNTLYKSTENEVTVYYFAGQDTASTSINNWVKFGEFYWRIIRTNSDGSIRLLYFGTNLDVTEGQIGTSAFNTNNVDSSKYAGYMYGDDDSTLDGIRANTNDSTIKTYIDNWYENNLTAYTNYLSNDAIYCNDREIDSRYLYSNLSTALFYFKSYERLLTNKMPTYDCKNNKDAFSVNNSEAKLKYSISLMTADEVVYAGGIYGQRAPMWFLSDSSYNIIDLKNVWWVLSPVNRSESGVTIWYVGVSNLPGGLYSDYIFNIHSVRPVVSLKSCVLWKSGDGSASSPYEIVENGGC